MNPMRRQQRRINNLALFSLLTILLTALPASAFDKLTKAQSWIYDRGHLANTAQGQVLSYQYSSVDEATAGIDDEASISITAIHDDGRRDVTVDFLSDERHLPLPPFSGFRGNPVIIAMLEHIAQSISAQTGGGALYFRNRIRDALASENVELQESKVTYNDNEYTATIISFYPFINDEHIGANELVRQSRFNIEISDDVPGGVFRIEAIASRDTEVFERTLLLK